MKTKVCMLVAPKKVELVEFEVPKISDNEILVKVEGCGICGTDVYEYKCDPFKYCPIVLGHEGTGEIIALGKNIKKDTAGKPVKVGDKIVTSVLVCNNCIGCERHPDKPNLCNNLGVYGLIPDSKEHHLNGWFADNILIRENSTFFVVNDLSLDERILLEASTVVMHSYHRAKSTNLLTFNSTILVQGCGPIGLLQIAVLKAAGFDRIVAVDGNEMRLNMAKELGADMTMDFTKLGTIEERVEKLNEYCGDGADFVFQCTGSPKAAADAFKYVRRGGGMCELGFFVNNGDCTINPHIDFCNKEITLVGSWVYSAQEYMTTMEFFKRAKKMGIPFEKLITHKFPLEEMDKAMETNIAMAGLKIAIINK